MGTNGYKDVWLFPPPMTAMAAAQACHAGIVGFDIVLIGDLLLAKPVRIGFTPSRGVDHHAETNQQVWALPPRLPRIHMTRRYRKCIPHPLRNRRDFGAAQHDNACDTIFADVGTLSPVRTAALHSERVPVNQVPSEDICAVDRPFKTELGINAAQACAASVADDKRVAVPGRLVAPK
jgi:hypothetical protein